MKTFILFVLLLPGLVTAQLTFTQHTGHGLTPVHGGMINADVNNDGNEDIFAFGYTNVITETYAVTLYLGNGNGGFPPAPTQPFASHQRVTNAEFIDYNNNGHVDLIATYVDINTNQIFISVLLNNGSGVFTPTHTFEVEDITTILFLGVADLNNNGDFDIFLSVRFGGNNFGTFIYTNNNNIFTKISSTGIEGFYDGDAVIFDYDQDGKKDILVSGFNGSILITKLYRNLGGMNFQEITTPLPPLEFPMIAVGNIDNNAGGFESVALAGTINGGSEILHVYLNTNGVFTLNQTLPGTRSGEIIFADLNNNDSLDLVVVGGAVFEETSRVYENDDTNFVLRRTFNPGLSGATIAIDFDNDGLKDIIFSGLHNVEVQLYAYKNTTQTMSVDDFNTNDVVMYPNPTRGQLTLEFTNDVEITGIMLTDIAGRVVNLPISNRIDMSRFSSGIYLVTVVSYDRAVTKKIIKQ